jgi:hypothetical protein
MKKILRVSLGKIKRVCRQFVYLPNTFNDCQLKALKRIHRGKRAFIIGNGPSLEIGDLGRLKNEITFASNRIFLAYEQTDWRPTYYTLADEIVARNNLEFISSGGHESIPIFNSSVYKYFKKVSGITFVNPPTDEGEKNWDPKKGFRAGHSIINFDLKLAYYMGIREIYVIGCDHSFEDKSKRTGEVVSGNEVIVSVGEKNHFHPEYRKAGETWTIPKMDLIENDFSLAAKKYRSNGGKIYNASRRTKLSVWPIISFDEVIS